MAKASNIVHQYFRKDLDDATLLVRLNPIQLRITEILIPRDGAPEIRELEADSEIYEDLKADGFTEASPLEFNLHLHGLL